MNELDPRLKARMSKLLALARRGVGGEQENASRMLEKLLALHGCTLEQLLDEEVKRDWVLFPCHDKSDRQLLVQLCCKVLNVNSVTTKSGKGVLAVELSPSEAVDVRVHFGLLRKALKAHLEKELDLARRAFFIANRVFPDSAADEAAETKLSRAEIAELLAAARKVKPTPLQRQLTHA